MKKAILLFVVFGNLWMWRILDSNLISETKALFAGKPAIYLNEQEKLVQRQRLNEYPPITFLPLAHWLEERKEVVAFYKILDNFSEVVDPNLYFFANHPRERVGVKEFEKFPYIFLPFFIIGLLRLTEMKKFKTFAIFLFFPLLFYSVFGVGGVNGPWLIFPFFVLAIGEGLSWVYLGVKKKKAKAIAFFTLFLLVFIQTFAYESF